VVTVVIGGLVEGKWGRGSVLSNDGVSTAIDFRAATVRERFEVAGRCRSAIRNSRRLNAMERDALAAPSTRSLTLPALKPGADDEAT